MKGINIIETQNLAKYYGNARGIEDVTLTVQKGDFFGFIGPNGAGKSTTIRILLGLIYNSGGDAKVFGMNPATNSCKILSKVGYVSSESKFHPEMRGSEVLRLSAALRHKNIDSFSNELCSRLQFDMNKRVRELSFGNRKKLAIISALQHKPELVILDEPTSGIDPLIQHEFFCILEELNAGGTTIFLSSHVLTEVQRYCRRTAIIKAGKVVACEDTYALLGPRVKRVTLSGDFAAHQNAPENLFGKILKNADGAALNSESADSSPGGSRIFNLEKLQPSGLSFLYRGDVKELLMQLVGLEIEDISISDPNLEEVFMHYYA